ncbi:MAG: hypothetical protein AAF675_09665 [Pseudomonadota bacterium]
MTIEQDTGSAPPSILTLLAKIEAIAKSPPKTEAKTALDKACQAAKKEYMDFSGIVDAYKTEYPALKGDMLKTARAQRDEAKSAIDDDDEIDQPTRDAIEALRHHYDERAKALLESKDQTSQDLADTQSALTVAETAVADARTTLDASKVFAATAKGWYSDIAGLHAAIKASTSTTDRRRVYALFLELEDVYANKVLARFGPHPAPGKAATPDWLLGKLNAELRALIEAHCGKYTAHAAALEATAAAETAAAAVTEFIEQNGRRAAFLREAQDVVPKETPTTPETLDPAANQAA